MITQLQLGISLKTWKDLGSFQNRDCLNLFADILFTTLVATYSVQVAIQVM